MCIRSYIHVHPCAPACRVRTCRQTPRLIKGAEALSDKTLSKGTEGWLMSLLMSLRYHAILVLASNALL